MYIALYTCVMKDYSIVDARAHLPDLLDEVEAGREVRLTRRGHAVAVVLSVERYEALRSERASFGEAYRAFLERHSIEEIGFDPESFESLRDRGPGRRVQL